MRSTEDAMLRNKFKNEFLLLLEWQEHAEFRRKREAIQEGIRKKCEYIRRTYGEEFYQKFIACTNSIYMENRKGKPDFLLE